MQDLLQLRVGDVKNAKIADRVILRERKTGKDNVFIVNSEIKAALDVYLSSSIFRDDHYLFKSRKGCNYPINTPVVTRLVKKWTSTINLKGNYGGPFASQDLVLPSAHDLRGFLGGPGQEIESFYTGNNNALPWHPARRSRSNPAEYDLTTQR